MSVAVVMEFTGGTLEQYDQAIERILNPSASLAPGTVYTVALTGGPTAIRDLAGNPLASSSWTFTSGA